jgi:hypothetical protein
MILNTSLNHPQTKAMDFFKLPNESLIIRNFLDLSPFNPEVISGQKKKNTNQRNFLISLAHVGMGPNISQA